MQNKELFLSMTAVCLIGLVTALPAAAQTDAEQAELVADATAGPAILIPGSAESPIDCGPGTFPTQYYFTDLEADDGGWAVGGYGEWEAGAITAGVQDGCGGTYDEPTAAQSGTNVWGTDLDGCYDNSGADSTLTQTFDLSGLAAPIELNFYSWYHVFETFDWAQVLVNGAEVWRSADSNAHDWSQTSIDLSAYAGNASVQIQFLLHATTVVNRMGMYVDDIEILYCEIPVGLQSFTVE